MEESVRAVMHKLAAYLDDPPLRLGVLDEAAYRCALDGYKLHQPTIEKIVVDYYQAEKRKHKWIYLCFLMHIFSSNARASNEVLSWLSTIIKDDKAEYSEKFYATLAILSLLTGAADEAKRTAFLRHCSDDTASHAIEIIKTICNEVLSEKLVFRELVVKHCAERTLLFIFRQSGT